MEYNIELTDEFLKEIEDICNYISKVLMNPDASNRLREKVIYNILLLEQSPKMFEETEKYDRVQRNYRRIVVNNYVILYTIDNINKKVRKI